MDQQPQQHGSQPSSSSTKLERRLIEKNRRNQMKILYSKLNSLLPNSNPKEVLPLPDQVDEAINYIKSLEAKVKMAQEKKERLTGTRKKRSSSTTFEANGSSISAKSPQLEIQEVGSSLQVVLTCGLDSQFIFHEIIRIMEEESIEVKSASYSLAEDSMHHVLHAEIPQTSLQFGATKVSERLKMFVNGSSSDMEIPKELWDYEFSTDDFWDF
ncbi:hypothetical protein RIF29_31407 [Crotalaria pallida]|uniref:BHLH domain-containing protein n=1 Tax=Crotalaria pallida TaxID=3830 RepID=A0AAN9EHQ0_CROPI